MPTTTSYKAQRGHKYLLSEVHALKSEKKMRCLGPLLTEYEGTEHSI